ncbi:amidohydrolase family protein [Gordonia sp. PKS22-38]|uniref:Amidohydrolase family protein n=1 Tax=Gordonia prachuapensis TaxID=3115651 RepID=A0ABU7MTQ2_9ACTN|nr:amidohydrolase family protein [Gordonia sp. PKS22-38]
MDKSLLIRNATLADGGIVDIRCSAGRIEEIGASLRRRLDEDDVDVGGHVLPGLHDHHIHLWSLAATAHSIRLGPPTVPDAAALRRVLARAAQAAPSGTWLRAFGYHESVAGPLTRDELDVLVPDHPIRVQHRSGALWMLNSPACRATGVDECTLTGVERDPTGRAVGRLWRMDSWLGDALPSTPPDLGEVSRRAASRGVTGFTDATPDLTQSAIEDLAGAIESGQIRQRVHCMARPTITEPTPPAATGRFTLGPTKILLDDDRLPDLDDFVDIVREAHRVGRTVAVHCVTRVQLILTMAALDTAGVIGGDRIEHGAIIPPECFDWLRERRITVVTQPNFPLERADQYAAEVPPSETPDLWRLGSLRDAGVAVAAGTDAPFGDPDPWRAIHAAVVDHSGRDPREKVGVDVALGMFAGSGDDPLTARRIEPGAVADLIAVRGEIDSVRTDPDSVEVVATVVGGVPIHLG